MKQIVTAAFDSNVAADRAIQDLLDAGIPQGNISTLMSRATRERYYPEDRSGDAAGWGAGIGAIAGGLIALAALGVPGGIMVAGPLAALLGGAAVGAVSGGLIGALIGMGIPEERARAYQTRIQRGGILVAVEVNTPAEEQAAEQALTHRGDPTARETLAVSQAHA
jgi:hypothetical protein